MDPETYKAERDFAKNPPTNAPGLGDDLDDIWDAMELGSSSAEGTSDNGFSGSNGNNTNGTFNSNSTSLATTNGNDALKNFTSEEDKMFEAMKVGAKGIWSGSKMIVKGCQMLGTSVKNNTAEDWHAFGKRGFYMSLIVFLIGGVLCVLKLFIHAIREPWWMMIGACVSCICSVCALMFVDTGKSGSSTYTTQTNTVSEPELDHVVPVTNDDDFDINSLFEDDEDAIPSSTGGGLDFGNFSVDDDEEEWDPDEDVTPVAENTSTGIEDIDDAIESIPQIPVGTYTRQYLFERYMSILPNISPNFATMEVLDEDSNEFLTFGAWMEDASVYLGIPEENRPMLDKIEKNTFIIRLSARKPRPFKEQEMADFIAECYARDGGTTVVHQGVYATVESFGATFVANIFTGDSAMVSLKDIYDISSIKNFILDTKNQMPFIWGIGLHGEVYNCSLDKCESILICGETRSGKSWKGQSIVAQLCMYNSPKEVEFYIFDHKNATSDYRYISTVLPHVRYFCGDAKKINSGIQRVIDLIYDTTSKELAKEGYLNIADYNMDHPDDKLPYRYVLIDEIQSLQDGYTKEESAELKGLLSTIVTKLPNMGIRLVVFPHRVVDSVIPKNVSAQISSRAVVRQLNAAEVQNAVEATPKQFPYKLIHNGDMAVKTKDIAEGTVTFVHAEVLTKNNNENKKVFKYIGSVWNKVEPDVECISFLSPSAMIAGSIGGKAVVQASKATVDNTEGKESYQYGGTGSIADVLDSLPDIEDKDESFWEDL